MNFLFAIIGATFGGMLFHFGGVIAGAFIGWLCGSVNDLRQRQDVAERELGKLRTRLDRQPFENHSEKNMSPAAMPATQDGRVPDMVVLTDLDIIHDEVPVIEKPEKKTESARQKPEPDLHFSFEPEPLDPSAIEASISKLFSGENLLVKLGVVILFFGVSFLVKYAAQHGLFPLELRLTAAALGGCALLATGWKLRNKRPIYAQVIQGGGIGILYLTTYAAMRLYHFIPLGAGFGFLVTICALAGFLAIAQNSRALAVMGSASGFLAPELASIGSGSHVVLFSYYAILNCGVLGIARYRAWRELNLLGFIGTFIVSLLWGSRFYRPEYFLTVEPFLVLFFLIYAALPVLYARREPTLQDQYVDVPLIFGTPLIAFAFQQSLVQGFEYGLAWSALAMGLFYLVLAYRLFRAEPQRMRTLAEALLAIGTLFTTLTIPLALDGRWTAAAWSIEGAALVWIGLRQKRLLARLFGYMLLIGSGVAFLTETGMATGTWPILNGFYIGCLLVSGAALFSAYLLRRPGILLHDAEQAVEAILFAWGMIWWLATGLHEIAEHTSITQITGVHVIFLAISGLACASLRYRLEWRLLDWPALGLFPAMVTIALLQVVEGKQYPSINGGWFGWPVAISVWYLILKKYDKQWSDLPAIAHAAPFWLLSLLGAWETYGRLNHHLPGMETWAMCAWGLFPALAVLLIANLGKRVTWPLNSHRQAYLVPGCIPLAAVALLWLFCANLTQAGNPWPLPYLPLINPLDGTTLLVLISLTSWYREVSTELPGIAARFPVKEAKIALYGTLFIWLNAILLRSIHHWCHVPYTAESLFDSQLVQATLSICWSLSALVTMILATRRGARSLWLGGVSLLGAVVAKLFLVDLANSGSVARIVSFVVVGLLILVIGWFSPVPPRAAEGETLWNACS